MGSRKFDIPGGLLIPERCQASAIADTGAGATDSSYGEATPRPGFPVVGDSWSQLRVQMSGEQGTDVDVRVIKSGHPARDGLQLAIKKDSEAATEWRGWDGPQLVTDFIPIDWDQGSHDARSQCTIPSSQKVVIAYKDSGSAEVAVVDTDHSVTLAAGSMAAGTDWNYPAIVCLPESERLICLYGGSTYYSDDEGETWSTLAEDITTESTTNYGHTTACVYRGDIVIFVEDTATSETIHHLVSTDGGASFNLVQSTASLGVRVNCTANDDGVHVVWVDSGTALEYRKLGTPFEALDAVTQTALATGSAYEECTIWADDNGALYVLGGGWEASLFESLDGGESWSAIYQCASLRIGDNTDALGLWRAAYSQGKALITSSYDNGGTYSLTRIGCIVLGGWSNVVVSVDDSQRWYPKNRFGFGARSGSGSGDGETWFPYSEPDNQGWTGNGAGTDAISAGALNISTTAGQRYFETNIGALTGIFARLHVRQVSGGSTSASDIAATFRIADASSFEYEVTLRIASTGYRVDDVNSAATSSQTVTMSSYVHILVYMDQGSFKTWHRSPGSTTWTAGADISITDAGATANAGRVQFGHISLVGTAESDWREVHWAGATTQLPVIVDSIASMIGKPFNARPDAIPDMGTTSGTARLAAVAGPARMAETVDIDAHYDHPIEHCHVESFPGLSTTWRSADTTEQVCVYDLGANGWVGHSVGLFVAGANFRTAYLESYNGSTWDTEATLDLAEGFTSLEYTLSGDTVYPDTGTTSDAGRWLWEQEKRGGLAIFNASVGPTQKATRITSQTAGGWTQNATLIPMLQLEDVTDISGLTGTKAVQLCSPSGFVVKHQTAVKVRRYWRWRIPAGTAGEDTPRGESYYEAAVIAVCRVQPFGAEVGWGNVDEAAPNVARDTDESGTVRARALGTPRRTWTLGGWASSPANMAQIRLGPNGDYVGSSETNALALAGFEDIYHHLRGLLRVADDGALPVIAVEPVPDASDTTVTDPARFLYGHLTSSVRATRATGDHGDTTGQGEVLRVDDIVVEEIR